MKYSLYQLKIALYMKQHIGKSIKFLFKQENIPRNHLKKTNGEHQNSLIKMSLLLMKFLETKHEMQGFLTFAALNFCIFFTHDASPWSNCLGIMAYSIRSH